MFDRMLASEAEIAAAQNYYDSHRAALDHYLGLTPEQKKRLEEKRTVHRRSAEAARLSQLVEGLIGNEGGRQAMRDPERAFIHDLTAHRGVRYHHYAEGVRAAQNRVADAAKADDRGKAVEEHEKATGNLT